MYDYGHYDPDGDIHRHLHSPDPPPPITPYPSFGHYDPDGDIYRRLHSPDPPPDITPFRNVDDFVRPLIRDLPFPTLQDGNPRSSSRLNPAGGQQAFTPIQPDQLGRESSTTQGVMNYYIFGRGEQQFEVYGSHGIFHYGWIYFQRHRRGDHPSNETESKFIDFRNQNFGWVKNYIDNYRMSMENNGHILVTDTLSNNLIMGSAVGNSGVDESYTPSIPDFGKIGESSQFRAGCTSETFPFTETNWRGGRTGLENMTRLAAQRVRTKNLRLKDLQPLFYLPSKRAAQELNLGLTAFKKVCRRNGIARWPYEKACKSS